MSTDPVLFLLKAAMRLPRASIETLTEGLIAGLDGFDGDPDLEDDDPAGDPTELDLSPRYSPVRVLDPRMVWFRPE